MHVLSLTKLNYNNGYRNHISELPDKTQLTTYIIISSFNFVGFTLNPLIHNVN